MSDRERSQQISYPGALASGIGVGADEPHHHAHPQPLLPHRHHRLLALVSNIKHQRTPTKRSSRRNYEVLARSHARRTAHVHSNFSSGSDAAENTEGSTNPSSRASPTMDGTIHDDDDDTGHRRSHSRCDSKS